MEASSDAELINCVRALCLSALVRTLPLQTQRAWEADVVRAAEAYRVDGVIRLGGVTRLVVATT